MPSLRYLAGRGDPFELLAALESGADPNERGHGGKTPLMAAAKQDNRVAARLLLKYGANVDAVDAKGGTALNEAPSLDMKRLLLDAGASPDLGRIAGMTLMAFFASFGEESMLDFLLAYGADPQEKTREGRSVQELLKDPDFVWRPLERPATPERRKKDGDLVLKLSDNLRLTPERYVAEHRDILIWGLHNAAYDDPALAAWATRVFELLRSPDRLEETYRLHLTGDDLNEALRVSARARPRGDREVSRKRRAAEFEAIHFPNA